MRCRCLQRLTLGTRTAEVGEVVDLSESQARRLWHMGAVEPAAAPVAPEPALADTLPAPAEEAASGAPGADGGVVVVDPDSHVVADPDSHPAHKPKKRATKKRS